MFVILVYDVKEERVQKLHKLCKRYLTWVQNSVFEGEITEGNFIKLTKDIDKIIDKNYDSVLIQEIGINKPSHEDFIF
jgi:CRISPR-associated protein Cas2